MYCQKCRTPLKLDSSLESLNPAAYDLLIATASQAPNRRQLSARPANSPDADRRALYDHVSKNAGPATFQRHSGGGGGGGGGNSPRSKGSPRFNSAMSFVLLSDSAIAPPGADFGGRERLSPGVVVGGSSGASRLGGGGGGGDAAGGSGGGGSDDADGHSLAASSSSPSQTQGMERITRLFEVLSARSDVDYPVCIECTDLLVEGLQQRLDAATRERDAYAGFLKQSQLDAPTADELRAQAVALEAARQQEAAAMAELLQLEKDKARLDAEVAALEVESKALDADEEQFWRERNAFASRLADFQNERDSINAKYDHDARLLESLQRSNVYNDTFCISHDGTFATINGLRLGRLSARPVDWPEINAAWGHALLLLVTVADKLGYRFENYEPLPMGSTSRIIRYDQPPSPASSRLGGVESLIGGSGAHHGHSHSHASVNSPASHNNHNNNHNNSAPPPAPKKHVLELYSSGDMPLGLTFMHRRFDNAMVAFLELVRQLGVFVHQQTAAEGIHVLSLPYRIEGDKIDDVSIKLGIAQDDGWTKACKLTLTCCKFLLAHASNVNSVSARNS